MKAQTSNIKHPTSNIKHKTSCSLQNSVPTHQQEVILPIRKHWQILFYRLLNIQIDHCFFVWPELIFQRKALFPLKFCLLIQLSSRYSLACVLRLTFTTYSYGKFIHKLLAIKHFGQYCIRSSGFTRSIASCYDVQIRHPKVFLKSTTFFCQSSIRNPQSAIRNPQSEILNWTSYQNSFCCNFVKYY